MPKAGVNTNRGLLCLEWKNEDLFYKCFRDHHFEEFGKFRSHGSADFEAFIMNRWEWVEAQNKLSLPNDTNFLFECVPDIGVSVLFLALYFPRAKFWLRNVSPQVRSVLKDGIDNSFSPVEKLSYDRFFFLERNDPRPNVDLLFVLNKQQTHEQYLCELPELMKRELDMQCKELKSNPNITVVAGQSELTQNDPDVRLTDVDKFILLDSVYGKFIVPRTSRFLAESLVKTGRTMIEEELASIFIIVDSLQHDSIIVDGGANVGFVTVPVAQRVRGKNIKVISFEPQRQLFNALSGSLALNELGHVYLHNYGLSDSKGHAELPELDYGKIYDYGIIAITKDVNVQEHDWMTTRKVNTVSIDIMNLPRLDFLKLDIEGHEVSALQGSIDTFKRCRPWIWVEYTITGAQVIKNTLSSLPDYNFYMMDSVNMVCVPIERSNPSLIQRLQSQCKMFIPV